jgi:mRNA interferase MazF
VTVGRLLARGDVVLVPFPFTDLSTRKLRPAVIVGRPFGDDLILAFVTSRASGDDPRAQCVLQPADPEFSATGLKSASAVRLNRLATLDRGLVRRRLGRIGIKTERAVSDALRYVFAI